MVHPRTAFLHYLNQNASTSTWNNSTVSDAAEPDNRMIPDNFLEESSMTLNKGLDFDSDDSVVDPNYRASPKELSSSSDSDEDYEKQVCSRKNKEKETINNETAENNKGSSATLVENNMNEEASTSNAVNNGPKNNSPSKPSKKRIADPALWKRNIEKARRLRGEKYCTIKGKSVKSRPLKPPRCLNKVEHHCSNLVSEASRSIIYQEFRSFKKLDDQRQFILNHVTVHNKKRCTTDAQSRRSFTKKYSFTVDGVNHTVCREFFLDTLNISEGLVRGALKKLSPLGILVPDLRGKNAPIHKLLPEDENFIHSHILSFPCVESHYCRKSSQYKYLNADLNIKIMYTLYKTKCSELQKRVASIEKYRTIFRTYKLKFHKPKKDLCKKCVAYNEYTDEEKRIKQEDYSKHLRNKQLARDRRDEDKSAGKNEGVLAFNFDLQAVLSTPKGAAGQFFYVRKLAVYNLTIYNLSNQDVDCFTWNETEGKRGSTEISTCIFQYLLSKENITHVRMMSDSCGRQQKNFNFSSMCLHLLKAHPSLQLIDHVFFEPGHTHMECDSIHSKIEMKSKNIPFSTPGEWIQVIRMARKNPTPFNVTTLLHDDFLDFNPQKKQFSTAKNVVAKFTNAVHIQYRKDSPNTFFIKTEYGGEFLTFSLKEKRGKNKGLEPNHPYSSQIPISKVKKQDLLKLCQDLLIPRVNHEFYKNLRVEEGIIDRLPEPDEIETSDEED